MDFADRLLFSATRARRSAIRRAVQTLSARAWATRLCARRSCTAAPAGDTSADAQPRALRYPWTGGFRSMARAAGVERIAEVGQRFDTCADDLDFNLFSSPTLPPAPVTSVDHQKAGPHKTYRNDAAVADRDNTHARRPRRSAA